MAEDGGSVVCAAKDAFLGRDVEMKVVRHPDAAPEAGRELLGEARRLARLQHPNIPPIYDVGLSGTGQVFYTVKTVRGMTLRDVLDQLEHAKTGALLHFTLKRLLAIFHKICDALAYAHAHGVTHGGMRPECIVLGDFGEVFITHWRLPRGGREIDPHEDIAALGRLLYEITTLERSDDVEATSASGAHHQPRRGRAKPSQHWAGDENVRTLLEVARRALDRKASDKFHSVREFQTLVDAFKDSFYDPAHLTLHRLVAEWARRYKIALIIVLALGLVCGVLGATAVIQKMLAPPATHAPANPDAGLQRP